VKVLDHFVEHGHADELERLIRRHDRIIRVSVAQP